MNFNFNYFKKLIKPNFYLCNPDGKYISAMNVFNDNFTLRFNDISEVSFDVSKHLLDEKGNTIEFPYFDLISSKRLVFIECIGWFQIVNALEDDTGTDVVKSITCESLQTKLKDIGFVSEERVYKFYNPLDPKDELYNASDNTAIPSIVGQLYQQLGIECDLSVGTPVNGYDNWTITYIPEALKYTDAKGDNNVCRTMEDEEGQMAYDFIINKVEESFEVVFNFDFLHKTIQIKDIAEVTEQKSNIYLSFDNLINEIKVEEKSEDIVTVLHCKGGNGLDIKTVNPTGKDYIVDFSYYMDEVNHNWMSQELINKLKEWNILVANNQDDYSALVSDLYEAYITLNELETKKSATKIIANDLDNAQTEYVKKEVGGNSSASIKNAGTFVEEVKVGEKSRDEDSQFNATNFTGTESFTCYDKPPVWNSASNKFVKANDAQQSTGTLETLVKNSLVFSAVDYQYFIDNDDTTYCRVTKRLNNIYSKLTTQELNIFNAYSGTETEKLQHFGYYKVVANNITTTSTQINIGKTRLVNSNGEYTVNIGEYVKLDSAVGGFVRYDRYGNLNKWIDIYAQELQDINEAIETEKSKSGGVNEIEEEMAEIANAIDLDAFLNDYPVLAKELKSYWVEGDYDNDNISLLDGDGIQEEIPLAKQLYDAGKIDLQRVSQPKFSITASIINFLQIYEFKPFIEGLNLGEVITIEKGTNLFYLPALTEISFSFDDAEDFTMTFSNSLKPNDSLFNFADLVKGASKTSRTVSSNWSDIMSYSRNKDKINDLLFNPFDATLRAANENGINQEFVIDERGIIGRKLKEDGYEKEQMRITNNVILFTDDNWGTIKTALGKVVFVDNGQEKFAYGLLAEVVVGDLIMSKSLKIKNESSSIILDENGILIKNGNTTVLQADTSGNLTVRGDIYANSLIINNGATVSINVNDKFKVNNEGSIISTSGTIGGFTISSNSLYNQKTSYNSNNKDGVYLGIDGIGLGKGTFYVNNEGTMYSRNGMIGSIKFTPYSNNGGGLYSTMGGNDLFFGVAQNNSTSTNEAIIGIGTINENSSGLTMTFDSLLRKNSIRCENADFAYVTANDTTTTYIDGVYSIKSGINPNYGIYFGVSGSSQLYHAKLWWNSGQRILRLSLYDNNGNLATLSEDKTFEVHYAVIWAGDTTWWATIPAGSSEVTRDTAAFWGIDYARFNSSSGSSTYYFYYGGTNYDSNIGIKGNLIPYSHDTYNLGTSGTSWADVYTTNGNVKSSDRNLKHSIKQIDERYTKMFDLLKPVSFIWNNNQSGRTHLGLIAQELKDAIEKSGLTTQLCGAYVEWTDESGQIGCGIRYEELIGLCIKEIQDLKQKIKILEANTQ